MPYKPPQIKNTFGPQGVAKVLISDDKKKVRVTFAPDEDGETKSYTLAKTECPSYVQKGKFFVRLSADENKRKMFSMTPLNGVFPCDGSHVTLRHKKDEKPAPTQDAFGNPVFQVDFEITDGPCKGMTASYAYSGLHYAFIPVKDKDLGKDVAGFKGKGVHVGRLINFCDVTGVWDKGAMAWADNLLGVIQKRISTADRSFQIVIKTEEKETKQGKAMTIVYVDSLIPADGYGDESDLEEDADDEMEETPKSKKASAKKPATSKKAKDEDEELPWEDGDLPEDESEEDEDEDTDSDDDFNE